MNVFAVIDRADRSAAPVAFETDNGVSIVGLRLEEGGNLVFADADAGNYMTQALFFNRYRWNQFKKLKTVPEIAGTDELDDEDDPENAEAEDGFPDIDQALDWAKDADNVSDEQVQAYLTEVAGEDNRKRNRDTAIEKVAAFVATQSA